MFGGSGGLQYGEFSLSRDEQARKDRQYVEQNNMRCERIAQHIAQHGWVELKSCYLDMCSYYYDPSTKLMYRVSNVGAGEPEFVLSNDANVLKLNSLL